MPIANSTTLEYKVKFLIAQNSFVKMDFTRPPWFKQQKDYF